MTFQAPQLWLAVATFVAANAFSASLPSEPGASNAVPAAPRLPPLPPRSPVDVFRELLAQKAAERKQMLTNRTAEAREAILAKVREYQSLSPEQRELRLRVTELRWYLLPLMSIPATNRQAHLDAIPPDMRKMVEDRLQHWDILPPDLQRELLDNEATIRYFSETESSSEEQKRRTLEGMSPARRAKLEAGIRQWQGLSHDQQRTITTRFQQFFELTPQDKAKALSTLSEAERRQIERTLDSFSRLPPAQRAECLRSFEKFASLSLEERQQFLKNAERWKLMSPDEREEWRQLVARLSQPPLPPGLKLPQLPPRPPHPGTRVRPGEAVATNR